MTTVGEKRPPSSSEEEEESSGAKKKKLTGELTNANVAAQVTQVAGLVPVSPSSSGDQEQATAPPITKTGRKKAKKKPQPPIKTLFEPLNQKAPVLPRFNDAWGRKPMPGPDGPKPHPDQPPARTSNAQTVPPLWEDRKFRFKKGKRFVQTFRRGEEMPEDAPADLDQQDNLILKLIDMRPKNRKDPTPRRSPFYYIYENGLPKDWNNKQTIKALNDRRQQAIDRITMDPPWTNFERDYLVTILNEYPEASILEIAERFNWRFMGQDFAKPTAFEWDYISTGRTTESIRHEYLTYKHKYDVGEIPKKKELADKSTAGKAAGKNRMYKFGNRDKAFDNNDSEDSDAEEDAKARKKMKSKKTKPKKSASTLNEHVVDEYDANSADESFAYASPLADQPQLNDGDEELLDLAGYNDRDVGSSSPDTSAVSEEDAEFAPLEDEQSPTASRRSSCSNSDTETVHCGTADVTEDVTKAQIHIEAQHPANAEEGDSEADDES